MELYVVEYSKNSRGSYSHIYIPLSNGDNMYMLNLTSEYMF